MKSFLSLFIVLGSTIGLSTVTFTQPKPTSGSEVIPVTVYNTKIKAHKAVVQFNSEWNKQNEFAWKPTPGVEYFKVNLDNNPQYKQVVKINSLPTLIVYENGKEVKRYEGGLQMKISVSQTLILNTK